MLRFAILTILLCRGLWASAETVYTVDCNGRGDFRTIQACFDALPSKPAEWRTVRIMPGTYREKVALETRGDRIHLRACTLSGNQATFFTRGYVSRVRRTLPYRGNDGFHLRPFDRRFRRLPHPLQSRQLHHRSLDGLRVIRLLQTAL